MRVTQMKPGDEDLLDRFLADHAESSMFLRSNMARAGLVNEGQTYQGTYLGAISESGEMRGVLAHYWNGNVMVQAPEDAALVALIDAFRDAADGPVAGILGPDIQARTAIQRLTLRENHFSINRSEGLYALNLDDLVVPEKTGANGRTVTEAAALPRAVLIDWLKAYEIEALGALDDNALSKRAVDRVERMIAESDAWALWERQTPVALCGFNASLPDIVQLGPVWTPPNHRNRGYARNIVAAALSVAHRQGVQKAILFTDNPAAIQSYDAIGFSRIGSYRLALLKEPIEPIRSDRR